MITWLLQQAKMLGQDGANLTSAITDPRTKRLLKVLLLLHRTMKTPPGIVTAFVEIMIGTTPLHGACGSGNLGVVELLIAEGARLDSTVHLLGRTPLIQAVRFGHLNIVRTLLEAGASPSLCDARKKRTPLQWARRTGKEEIAALLSLHDVAMPAGKGSKKYQVAPAPQKRAESEVAPKP